MICPQCGEHLIQAKDSESRYWQVCPLCHAQFPEDWGEGSTPLKKRPDQNITNPLDKTLDIGYNDNHEVCEQH